MSLADRPATSIDGEGLRQALEDGEREGIRVEYKLRLDPSDTRETALDVTSLANTAGGVLLVGADETDGRLSALPGLQDNVDEEIQRLESILRSRVDPTLPPSLVVRPVEIDAATVLVVAVPRSWRRPHLVRSGSRWTLARRNSSGKYPLQEASEVRAAFLESDQEAERARRWHEDRIADVLSGEAPVELPGGPFGVLTVRPLAANAPGAGAVLDVAAARADDPQTKVQPLYWSSTGPRVNLDGLISLASVYDDGTRRGYAQLYRDGSLAYIEKGMFDNPSEGVPGNLLLVKLLEAVERALQAIQWAGASLPAVVQLSLHGLSGVQLHTTRSKHSFTDWVFDRDWIQLPEVIIDEPTTTEEETALTLRVMLDALWNAVGVDSCEHFDGDTWAPTWIPANR